MLNYQRVYHGSWLFQNLRRAEVPGCSHTQRRANPHQKLLLGLAVGDDGNDGNDNCIGKLCGFPLWLPGDSPPCSCACKWCCYLAPGDENGRHIIQGAVTAAKQHITLWSTQIEHVGNLNGCICVYVFSSETSRTWGCPVQLCNRVRISQDDHSWCHGITGHQWYRISWRMNTCWW